MSTVNRGGLNQLFWVLLALGGLLLVNGLLFPGLWTWLLAGLPLAAAAGLLLLLRPPALPSRPASLDPAPLLSQDNSDIWLWAAAGAFYLPWYNAATKEMATPRVLTQTSPGHPPRLLILPLGTRTEPAFVAWLAELVAHGTWLLVECPGPELAALAGATANGDLGPVSTAEAELMGQTLSLPLARMQRYLGNHGEPLGLLSRHPLGQGGVYLLAMQYAPWAQGLCQGWPEGTFRPPRMRDLQGLQTPHLQHPSQPPFQYQPLVDIFDQALWGILRDQLRLPAWWYHPQGKPAAFCLSFDEDWAGSACREVAPPGFPHTWFLPADTPLPKEMFDDPAWQGAELQLHWNRFLFHMTPLGPHICLDSLASQIEDFRRRWGVPARGTRIHYLRWQDRSNSILEVMAQAGLEYDSTFGPGRGQHGFRFSTGFPLQAGDPQGRPAGIIEVVFQAHDPMGGAGPEDHVRLLDEALHNHTAVVSLFHPYHCRPGGASHANYQAVLDRLGDWPGWLTGLGGLVHFWRARQQAELSSRWRAENELLLTIRVPVQDGLTLRLPKAGSLAQIWLDSVPLAPTPLLVLSQGVHQVALAYHNAVGP